MVVTGFSLINLSRAGLLYPIFILIILFVLNKDRTEKYSKKSFIIIIVLILLFHILFVLISSNVYSLS